jgi:hypothetical protein
MDDSIAANDIANGLGRLIERLSLLIFNPLENPGYSP